MKKLRKSLLTVLIPALFFIGIIVFLIWGLPREKELPLHAQFPGKVSEILGEEETCMNCHGEMTGFAPAHDPKTIGCSPCHLGNPRAEGKRAAHRDMIAVPGNLEDAFLTCGTKYCHQNITIRVKRSLMNTMSGVVSVNRYAFGEQDSLDGLFHIQHLSTTGAADNHLRNLCASCHLGNNKEEFGPIAEHSRGGGCNACHLNYSAEALADLHNYYPERSPDNFPQIHPVLNLQVSNEHCFGCHSRSGRISTSYEGWHETQLTAEEVAGQNGYRELADGRIFRFIAPDVHHAAGLECIDCHHATEIMGDGNRYEHEEEAIKVHCEDCHFSNPPPSVPYAELDEESQKILALRDFRFPGHQFVTSRQSGVALLNVLLDPEGDAFMVGKNEGERHELRAPAAICTRGQAHQSLTCNACHTEWSPQCVGCHTDYDKSAKGFDLLAKKRTDGKWMEYLGEFFPEPPTLGIVEAMDTDSQSVRAVKTFIPGMIMTLDRSGFTENADEKILFHRLFAPTVSHTVNATGRSCISCHNDPLALGYGRGQLNYIRQGKKGSWQFTPEYVGSEYDQLPQDAWTGFLRERRDVAATRSNARPFNIAEQRRILAAGACLTCHDGNSEVMLKSLEDFDAQIARASEECVLPEWE